MAEQFPSVGRIVHYRSRGSADGMFPQMCRAAIVTGLPGPREGNVGGHRVSLCVLNPEGMYFNPEIDEDQGVSNGGPVVYLGGTWHWAEWGASCCEDCLTH